MGGKKDTEKKKPPVTKTNKNKQDGDDDRDRHLSDNVHSNSKDWNCTMCPKIITDDSELAMECSLCQNYFCLPCISLSATQYAAVQVLERDDFLWVCSTCKDRVFSLSKPDAGSAIIDGAAIEVRVNNLESKLESMISDLNIEMKNLKKSVDDGLTENKNSIEKSVENLKKSVDDGLNENKNSIEKSVEQTQTCSEEVKKSFAEAVIGNDEKNDDGFKTVIRNKGVAGYMKQIIDGQTASQAKEDHLKEIREKNIIIYNANELKSDSTEDRKAHDLDFSKKMLKAINRENIQVQSTFRLGRFDDAKHNQGKCRPLKITLHSKNDRDSVIKNAFKLGSVTDDELKKVNIQYDLSPLEKAELQKKN